MTLAFWLGRGSLGFAVFCELAICPMENSSKAAEKSEAVEALREAIQNLPVIKDEKLHFEPLIVCDRPEPEKFAEFCTEA